jgi:hypothetical protein
MLAFILWLTLGWRAGAVELLAELAIGLILYGGGGGRRIRRALRHFTDASLRLRAPAPA